MSFSYTLYTVKGEIFRSARACSELKTRARSCPRTPIWRSLVSSTTRASSENVTSRSCNNFSIITNHLVCRMRTYYPGFKLAEAVWISETKHSSSQVTSVLRDNVCVLFLRNKRIEKLSAKKKKPEWNVQTMKCASGKRAGMLFFSALNMQICRFLLPWLLKLSKVLSSVVCSWFFVCYQLQLSPPPLKSHLTWQCPLLLT